MLSELYNPETAVESGFLDEIVEADQLMIIAQKKAEQYSKLSLKAHKDSKKRTRKKMLRSLKWGRYADKVSFVWTGVKRVVGLK